MKAPPAAEPGSSHTARPPSLLRKQEQITKRAEQGSIDYLNNFSCSAFQIRSAPGAVKPPTLAGMLRPQRGKPAAPRGRTDRGPPCPGGASPRRCPRQPVPGPVPAPGLLLSAAPRCCQRAAPAETRPWPEPRLRNSGRGSAEPIFIRNARRRYETRSSGSGAEQQSRAQRGRGCATETWAGSGGCGSPGGL